MQVNYLIPAVVTDQDKKGPVSQEDIVFYERANTLINFLLCHAGGDGEEKEQGLEGKS